MSEFMIQEINQQPLSHQATINALLQSADEIEAVFNNSKSIVFIARGTSDNVANFGLFAFPILSGKRAYSISPSLLNNYQVQQDFSDAIAIAISQSGETNEIVSATEIAKKHGATIVSITNTPGSSLQKIAHFGFVTPTGKESAVPATKSYSTALLAMAWFAASAAKNEQLKSEILQLPNLVEQQLGVGLVPDKVVQLLANSQSAVFAGRGIAMGAAFEAALKLKETSGQSATGMSVADLVHGPIAALNANVPLVVVSGSRNSPIYPGLIDLIDRASKMGAPIVTFGDFKKEDQAPLHIPMGVEDFPELLSPILLAVPSQLLALKVSQEKGLNPDSPLGLKKITETA